MAISRLAWAVLVLTVIGAVESLFGPQERLWGVDVGNPGASLFGLTLWIGAALFAVYPERIVSPGWSIAERRAWVLRGGERDVIEADERDQRLRGAADGVGDWMLTILVAWCVGLLIGQPADRLWWLTPMIAANVLVGILIAKTFVEHAYLAGRYAWDRR